MFVFLMRFQADRLEIQLKASQEAPVVIIFFPEAASHRNDSRLLGFRCSCAHAGCPWQSWPCLGLAPPPSPTGRRAMEGTAFKIETIQMMLQLSCLSFTHAEWMTQGLLDGVDSWLSAAGRSYSCQ